MKTEMFFEGYKVYLTNGGYPTITVDGERVSIHRLVMERKLGRSLEGLDVHHINGNRLDWSEDNLLVLTPKEHDLLHAKQEITRRGGDPDKEALCGKCHRILPHSEFRKDSEKWNEVTCYCRECHAQKMREYRKMHPSRIRMSNQKAYQKTVSNPEKRAELLRKQREWYSKPENKAKGLARQKAKRDAKKENQA